MYSILIYLLNLLIENNVYVLFCLLQEKIQTLTAENEALKERLREEEERRRALADKSLVKFTILLQNCLFN